MPWIFIFSVAFSGNSVQNLFPSETEGHHVANETNEPVIVEKSKRLEGEMTPTDPVRRQDDKSTTMEVNQEIPIKKRRALSEMSLEFPPGRMTKAARGESKYQEDGFAVAVFGL